MIHPTAIVKTPRIGEGTVIWQYCIILDDVTIGDNCNINCNVFIENNVQIGNNVTVKPGVQLWNGIIIENDVFIGPNVTFTNDLKPRSKHHPEKYLTTRIREGASIGANSTILAGLTVGKYSMIGAGSVVTKDIQDFSLWYGNPAQFRGYVCICGNKLTDDLYCNLCKKYNNNIVK